MSTTTQEQFASIAKRVQDAVSGGVRTWLESVQRLAGQPGRGLMDVNSAVDSAYDMAEQALAMQREFTKNMLKTLTQGTWKVTDTATRSSADAAGNSRR